jgi:anthranilate synthase component 1
MIDKKFEYPLKPHTKIIATDIDYYELFKYIQSKFDTCYMYESLSQIKHQDYNVSIGFSPMFTVKAKNKSLQFKGDLSLLCSDSNTREFLQEVENPYYFLRNIFPQNCYSKTRQGGLIGYFSHETINHIEPSINLEEHKNFGCFELGFYDDGLIYNTMTGTLEYYYYLTDRSKEVEELVKKSIEAPIKLNNLDEVTSFGNNISKEEYKEIFEYSLEEIKKGNTFQVEVGVKTKYHIKGNKFIIYDKLRQINPTPLMFFVKFENRTLLGASPELLISCAGKKVLTSPAAGTAKRGETPKEDIQLARALLSDPKEIAEHSMLVDQHRNDIGRVSKNGSVRIDNLMYLIKFSHVQHIASDIVGQKDEKYDALDVLACILPGGVLTGAPKIETIKIIDRNEKEPRGPYGGAVGRFSFNGDCSFYLPIRSLFCHDDDCFAQTCSGVVLDSKMEHEYLEVERKLQAMKVVIEELEKNT